MIVLCVVGNLAEGMSGGYLYDADVYQSFLGICGESGVELWQLGTWHPLFGKAADGAHDHGQASGSGVGSLMSSSDFKKEYKRLPAGS